MGLFGTNRFHELYEPVDAETVSRYGNPARRLLMESRQVVDETNNVVYWIKSSMFTIRHKTGIYDTEHSGPVAHYERQLFSLDSRFFIKPAEGVWMEFYSEGRNFVVSPPGWRISTEGTVRNCEIFDSEGKILAVIGRETWSLTNKFSIDIYAPEQEVRIVAVASVLRSVYAIRTSDVSV